MWRGRSPGLVAALLLLTAGAAQGCHLLFPFAADKPGAADASTTLLPDSAADGPAPLDTHADEARVDLPPSDLPTSDRPAPDLPAPDAATYSPPGTWVLIPPGTFFMGSPTGEFCREVGETQHKVTLTHKFLIQTTEVTQAQYSAVMGFNPTTFAGCGSTCAVEGVNFHLAAAYCNALSLKAGLPRCYVCSGKGKTMTCQTNALYDGSKVYDCVGYRLPTEAEWEYAYRAGTKTALYNGKNDPARCKDCATLDLNAAAIGWYCANKNPGGVKPVGQKKPNAWGLYDMAGNLWEWCHDRTVSYPNSAVTDPVGSTSTNHRILRGGSWFGGAEFMRAAQRVALELSMGGGTDGLRCVRHIK